MISITTIIAKMETTALLKFKDILLIFKTSIGFIFLRPLTGVMCSKAKLTAMNLITNCSK